jgi:hypothetical protein
VSTNPSSHVKKTTTHRQNNRKTQFTIAAGEEFEIYPCKPEVEYIDAVGRLEETRTRNSLAKEDAITRTFLAKLMTAFLLASLTAAGLYGLLIGHIEIVAATWTGILATLTLILGFYFKRRPKPK